MKIAKSPSFENFWKTQKNTNRKMPPIVLKLINHDFTKVTNCEIVVITTKHFFRDYFTTLPVSEAKYERAIWIFDVFMFGMIHEHFYSEPISSKIIFFYYF